jgi:hypothetical protein
LVSKETLVVAFFYFVECSLRIARVFRWGVPSHFVFNDVYRVSWSQKLDVTQFFKFKKRALPDMFEENSNPMVFFSSLNLGAHHHGLLLAVKNSPED